MRLEDLPNELLIEVFQRLDARTLYQCFYHLNSRLDDLLCSLSTLCLILWPEQDTSYDDLFVEQVQTLIIPGASEFLLSRYPRLRRLILVNGKAKQITELLLQGAHLTSLSLISPRCFYSTFIIHEMIFSNKFPRLTSCHLTTVYSPSSALRHLSWQQSPLLRSLRISSRDPLIHVAVLTACPNLNALDLSIVQLDRTPTDIPRHERLKRLRLFLDRAQWPTDPLVFKSFFFSMPSVERLAVHRLAGLPHSVDDLLRFDWLAPVIDQRLLSLQQLTFCLHLSNTSEVPSDHLDGLIDQMRTKFHQCYEDTNRSSLRISLLA
jgi:hypothetical protein